MADIFLSYARADQPKVEKMAVALEDAGYSLWWDRNIEGGHHFARDIQRELEAATTVIVCWSKNANESHWVLDEAGYARDHGKLLPIALDQEAPPLGFRQVQAINFAKWPRDAAPLQSLVNALHRRFDRERETTIESKETAPSRRALLWVAGAIVLLSAALLGWFAMSAKKIGEDDEITIAVLPFTNSAGVDLDGQRQSYPAAVIDGLGHLPSLDILSARTSFAEAGTNLSSTALAEKLGADYLIEGDIQRDNDSLRVTTRIVDGAVGRPIWSGSRHGPPESLPELQRRSLRQVSGALQGQLGIGLGYLPSDTALTGEALDQYRDAMTSLLNWESSGDAISAYNGMKRAVELAPNSADAHAGLAWVLTEVGPYTLSMEPEGFREENRTAYEKALSLDPDNLFAKMAKAETIHKEDGDVEQAISLTEEVNASDPNFGPAHSIQTTIYDSAGDFRAALRAADRALALSPYDEQMIGERANVLTRLGNYSTQKSEALACTVDCGAYGFAWAFAIAALVPAEDLERELDQFEDFARAGDVDEVDISDLTDTVRSLALGRRTGNPSLQGSPVFQAIFQARTGNEEEALLLLQGLVEGTHAGTLRNLLWNGRFEFPTSMRSDPRYHALFEAPKYRRVIDYRRSQGVLHGLPIDKDAP